LETIVQNLKQEPPVVGAIIGELGVIEYRQKMRAACWEIFLGIKKNVKPPDKQKFESS